jgi:predicted amino acid-binding ACT domain protein
MSPLYEAPLTGYYPWHVTDAPTHWILTLVCEDRPGIVHAVSGAVVEAQGNITESHQFSSEDTGRFFMRLQVESAASRERFVAALAPVVERFGMAWQLDVVGRPTRTLVLVSTAAHCLGDLLYRRRAGQLAVDIPLVLGNHPDLADLARFYEVPFESHPMTTPGQRLAFEDRILEVVGQHDIELVVLARYMQILSPELCDALAGRKPVPAGSRARSEAHRSDRAFRHERPRRGSDHRAERRAGRPQQEPDRTDGDRPGRGVAHADPGGRLVLRAPGAAGWRADDHLPLRLTVPALVDA